MGLGKSLKKAYSKVMGRGPLSIVGMGKGGIAGYGKGSGMDKAMREVGHGAGYLTGANAMEDLMEAKRRADEQAIIQAERQASIAAGNVQQTSDAGTSTALAKLLKKRSQAALAKASPTLGQARGNTTLG